MRSEPSCASKRRCPRSHETRNQRASPLPGWRRHASAVDGTICTWAWDHTHRSTFSVPAYPCLSAALFYIDRSPFKTIQRRRRRCFVHDIADYRYFVTARRYASAVCAVIMCLSVCPSVTRRCCTKTAKRIDHGITPCDSPGTLVFGCQRSRRNSNGVTPTRAPNRGRVDYNRRFSTNISLNLRNGAR